MELIAKTDDYLHAKMPGSVKMCLQMKSPILKDQKFDNVLRQHLGKKGIMLEAGPCTEMGYDQQYKGYHKNEKGIHITIWMQ